jgi:hypothetical protein
MIQLENTLSDQYLDEPDAVKRYIAVFERICENAYGTDRSREVILEVSKEF